MRLRAGALALVGSLAGSLALIGCSQDDDGPATAESPATSSSATSATPTPTPTPPSSPAPATPAAGDPTVVATIATGLEAPWGLAFLPDGDAIVTERDTARVLRISGPDHEVTEIGTLDIAAPAGEAGALGVAVSPTFATDRTLFFYVSTDEDNRVVRTTLGDSGGEARLGALEPILTGIPNGQIHDGGRLEFGPDGFLYVSTGETGQPELAQDRDSLGGKILRITTDGEPAPGNPFGTEVLTYGHRNVQGLAFVGDQLWASEFGQSAFDELNRIDPGDNYGWPEVEGEGGTDQGYVDPQQVWGTDEASPSGLAYAADHLWMASLRGSRLWRLDVEDGRATDPTAYFVGDYGRMRTVVAAPDGTLWLTTSNRDGRGDPADGDDRILSIQPS